MSPEEMREYLGSLKWGELSALAKALGMHRQSISRMNTTHKHKPRADTLAKIQGYKEGVKKNERKN